MIIDTLTHGPPVTARPGESVRRAARRMERRGVSCLVVMEEGKLVGIVTESDIVERVVAAGRDPTRTAVRRIMTHPVIHVPPSMHVDEAAALMERRDLKRLVVMLDDEVRGIITVRDIAYAGAEVARRYRSSLGVRWEG